MIFYAISVFTIIVTHAYGAGVAPHEIDCTDAPDGLFEIGCWGYANCINEVPDVHACPVGLVLERQSMTCISPGSGQTDCQLSVTCAGKADGSYPDFGDKCVTYYRCQGGLVLGRFYCPDPTAFNEDLGICDYPRNLRAPCGPLPAKQTPASVTVAPVASTTTAKATASTVTSALIPVTVTAASNTTTTSTAGNSSTMAPLVPLTNKSSTLNVTGATPVVG